MVEGWPIAPERKEKQRSRQSFVPRTLLDSAERMLANANSRTCTSREGKVQDGKRCGVAGSNGIAPGLRLVRSIAMPATHTPVHDLSPRWLQCSVARYGG